MTESDGSIVKFSVDRVGEPADPCEILWPSYEAAAEIKALREKRGGRWEINRVAIYEEGKTTICA